MFDHGSVSERKIVREVKRADICDIVLLYCSPGLGRAQEVCEKNSFKEMEVTADVK